jgi:hypothetical protein
MKKTMYKVVGLASSGCCLDPGYSQCYIAFDVETERPVAYHYTGPEYFRLSQAIQFSKRIVASFDGSPEEAIRRFLEWQQNGYSEEWLRLGPVENTP